MQTKILKFMVVITVSILLLGCPNQTTPNLAAAVQDTVINLVAIPGVTAPVTGATPVTAITETAQYTGTVAWNGMPANFAASTVYTATITLTAKTGCTLSGVTANSFTLAGASASNAVNSGVVTAVFPVTASIVSQNIGNLMLVPAGTFQRDATATNTSTVSAFRMSQHEITGEQYAAVMGVSDPSNFASVSNNPVEFVSWYDAIEFCNKLSTLDLLTPVYTITERTPATGYPIVSETVTANWSANGYRLPTDMEWMWAAMGATSDRTSGYTGIGTNTTGYNKAFAGSTGSNTIGDFAWYTTNSGSTTHTVGTKTANELGLYDMSGNVLEWIWDWYNNGYYPSGVLTDYRGRSTGTYRDLRGGSLHFNASYCHVAFVTPAFPNGGNFYSGFRVVRL